MSKKSDDLSGQRFGKLTVLGRSSVTKYGRPTWNCRCDCGNHVDLRTWNLKNKPGCKICAHKPKNDLTGQRFGRLTVTGLAPKTDRWQYKWSCLCDCGNTTTVIAHRLKTGETKSCGCLQAEKRREGQKLHQDNRKRFKNLEGQRFGRLIVLEQLEVDRHGHNRWLCRCACGNQKSIIGSNLVNGLTKSCGCLRVRTIRFRAVPTKSRGKITTIKRGVTSEEAIHQKPQLHAESFE